MNKPLAAQEYRCYLRSMTTIPIANIRNFAIIAHIDHAADYAADDMV
jgi:hypothetical protein